MLRDFLTNKWILGGIAFVIVFAVACVWWYHYDTAYDRQQAAKSEEVDRQSDKPQKVTETISEIEQTVSDTPVESAPVESMTQSTEKPTIETIISETKNNVASGDEDIPEETLPTENTEHVNVSPHGFGAYPKVPDGFPVNIRVPWLYPEIIFNANSELAARVLIKLWNQGDTSIIGASYTEDQKVYPYYPNTVYVNYREHKLEDGTILKTISEYFAPPGLPEITDEMMISGIIPGVHQIDAKEGAIDALQFLNLE